MSLRTRLATPRDRERCLALIASMTGGAVDDRRSAVYDMLLDGERGDILVAEEDGVVLGTASVSYNLAIRYGGPYAQLEELIVDPAARGKNAGGLLVQAVVDRAREQGCAEIGLYLIERTETNRPFYEKYGFAVVGSEMRRPL